MCITGGTGESDALTTGARGHVVVVDADVYLTVGCRDITIVLCGGLADILDETVGRIGTLMPLTLVSTWAHPHLNSISSRQAIGGHIP